MYQTVKLNGFIDSVSRSVSQITERPPSFLDKNTPKILATQKFLSREEYNLEEAFKVVLAYTRPSLYNIPEEGWHIYVGEKKFNIDDGDWKLEASRAMEVFKETHYVEEEELLIIRSTAYTVNELRMKAVPSLSLVCSYRALETRAPGENETSRQLRSLGHVRCWVGGKNIATVFNP